MEKDGVLKIINEEGQEKEYYILFTFDSEETNKSYVVYTDYSRNEENDIRVFSSSYNPNDETNKLDPVIEEKELYTINNLLKGIEEDIKYELNKETE